MEINAVEEQKERKSLFGYTVYYSDCLWYSQKYEVEVTFSWSTTVLLFIYMPIMQICTDLTASHKFPNIIFTSLIAVVFVIFFSIRPSGYIFECINTNWSVYRLWFDCENLFHQFRMKFLILIFGILLGEYNFAKTNIFHLHGDILFIGINVSAMSRLHRRPPSEYDEFSCPRRCNEAYYPMCGVNKAGDIKIFTNDCYMSMENCNQLPQQGLLSISKPPTIPCYP